MKDRAPRIGLVLGGGGIAGYAFHCAVLAALQEVTGFDPRTAEVMVGTSAGAIVAGVVRGDVPVVEMTDRLVAGAVDPSQMPTLDLLAGPAPNAVPKVWAGPGAPAIAARELRRGRGLRVSRLLAALLPEGRSDLTPLSQPLTELHPSGWPDRPLWIPATDLRTGRLTVFGRTPDPHSRHRHVETTVSLAVQASAALPVYFAPVEIDGRSYIDGGIGSPYNANVLLGYGSAGHGGDRSAAGPLDLVIILAPLSAEELTGLAPVSSAARSFPRRRLHGELRRLRAEGTTTVVFQPSRSVARAMGLNPMSTDRVPIIVDRSQRMLKRRLQTAADEVIEVLERAARTLRSPVDAPYPNL